MTGSITKVAVLGATGQQGGAVAKALSDKGIPVVAITRNTESEKAKALAARPHTEVRQADLNDVASLEKAFAGCDGCFVIANFWEGMNAGAELQHYKNATDALKKVGGMKHVVFSTLEETAKTEFSKDFKVIEEHETGPMTVPHFDGKARAEAYFEGLPTTFMVTSCYFENFTSFFSFVENKQDGTYSFTLPLGDKKIPWTILADLGELVACTFTKPELIGKRIGQNSYMASGEDLARLFSEATGKTIRYNCVDWETFASFGFPGADELAQMFEFWLRTYEVFCADRAMEAQTKIMNGVEFTNALEYAKTLPLKFE